MVRVSFSWRSTVFSRLNESVAYGNVNPLDVSSWRSPELMIAILCVLTYFQYDAWDGYQSNRNRTFKTLYDNNIGNNIVISGDSHANWVSDLVWLDQSAYDPASGKGSIGVEFAGTAVSSPSPYGQNITIAKANNASSILVNGNRELQWSEIFYRGYFELQISMHSVNASYFGLTTTKNRNSLELSLANFTVLDGANALHRNPVPASGKVESGYLKGGIVVQTNRTNDTTTGKWSVYSWVWQGNFEGINEWYTLSGMLYMMDGFSRWRNYCEMPVISGFALSPLDNISTSKYIHQLSFIININIKTSQTGLFLWSNHLE